MAAVVELDDFAVAAGHGCEFMHHFQTVGLGVGTKYGIGNGDFFQVADVVGKTEIVVQLQGAPGHCLPALGLDPAAGFRIHALSVGNSGGELVVEQLGVVIERQVCGKPVVQIKILAAVVIPFFSGEWKQGAVHGDETIELVLSKFGRIADHNRRGQGPAEKDYMLQSQVIDQLLDVLGVALDGVSGAGFGGIALPSGI